MQSLIKSIIPLLVIDNNTKVEALQDNLFNQYNILPQENFDYLNITLSQNNLLNQATDLVYTAPILSPTLHSTTYNISNESQEIVAKPTVQALQDGLWNQANDNLYTASIFSGTLNSTTYNTSSLLQERSSVSQEIVAKPTVQALQDGLWNQATDLIYTAPILSPTLHSTTYNISNESQEIVAKQKLEGNNPVSDELLSNRKKTIDNISPFSSEMIATKIVRRKITEALTDNNISYDNVNKVINDFNQNNTQEKSLSQYLSKLILPIVASLTKLVCSIINNVPKILALAVTAGCIKYAIKPLIACIFIAAFIKFGIAGLVPCIAIAAYGKYYKSQEQPQVWERLVSSNNHNNQSRFQ